MNRVSVYIIQGLVPIATALWALVLLPEEWVTPVGAVDIVVGFLGVGLVIRPDPSTLLQPDLVGKLVVCLQVTSVSPGRPHPASRSHYRANRTLGVDDRAGRQSLFVVEW